MTRRLLAITLILLLLSGCASNRGAPGSSSPPSRDAQPQGPQKGGTIRLALQRDPIGFDPHVAYGISNSSLQGNVYDTLVEYTQEGKIVGALAESWETPDDRTFVFKLRQGVKFQDGSDFSAKDVLATFNRIRNPRTGATRKATVEEMESVDTPDGYTVKVVLKKPDATFLHALASYHMFIVSHKDVESGFDFKTKLNGTGPFMLESWEPQASYILVRNPNYWKPGLPYINKLVEIPIQDDKARMNALRSGEVDFAEYVPWQEMEALEKDGRFDVYRHFTLFNLVRLNVSKPPLDKKLVRQALNYVVDRPDVVKLAFGGMGRVVSGPLQPPGSPYYFTELENFYKKDWDKARELLKQAGYNSPADVPPLEFTVSTLAVHSETAQVVQQQLQSFGLKVIWKTVDVPTMTANRTAGTYVMQMDGLSMAWPDPDYLRPYYHSKGTSYATGAKFQNARLDELLEKGSATLNEAVRKQVYLEAEKLILDEAPWIFLLWRPQAEAAYKKVKGYKALPGGLGSYNVNLWEYVWIDKNR